MLSTADIASATPAAGFQDSAVAGGDVLASDRSPQGPALSNCDGSVGSSGHDSSNVVCTLKPSLDLQQDYFAVFGLQPACDIDLQDLAARYRAVQQAVHPDRFMRECDRSQRLAQQQAALANTAYRTLKSPLLRAQYLLELAGQHRAPETTTRDTTFLMQQMLLRERLDEASNNPDALDALLRDVRNSIQAYSTGFAAAWQAEDWLQAQMQVDRLQFACKLAQEIDDRQERLLD